MKGFKSPRKVLHVAAGGVVALIAVCLDPILGKPPDWGTLQSLALLLGLGILTLGFAPVAPVVSRTSTNLCLSLLALISLLAVGEGAFRAVSYDFAAIEEGEWRATPPYFRVPRVPTGEGFYRRAGPQAWTGQVLRTDATRRGLDDSPYSDEPVITVHYDSLGFRNPDDLTDWDVAVAGDSWTELGHLSYDQLFTTQMGAALGMRVKNIGISHTGPFAQLGYLSDYGVAESTSHTIIVFFEGNDIPAVDSEYNSLMRWRSTGERSFREFPRESSLVRALYRMLRSIPTQLSQPTSSVAYFTTGAGPVEINIHYTPPSSAELADSTRQRLTHFFEEYSQFGTSRQLETWLAYMPSMRRVLHGLVDFTASTPAEMSAWEPTDLPDLMADLSREHGIMFMDLTPALVSEATRERRLLHNRLYDPHLNAAGSAVVGRTMEQHLLTRLTATARSEMSARE